MGSEQNKTNPNVKDLTARIDDNNASNLNTDRTSRSANDLNANGGSNDVNRADEVLKNLHKVPYVYRQDIVRHKTNGVIGIVNEVAGDSDSDSSITDDEDDEDDEAEDDEDEADASDGNADNSRSGDKNNDSVNNNKTLQADQVRVLWTDDTSPIQHVNNIKVVDRGFLHGDYVASASDPTGQVGVVLDVNISVDLLAPDGSVKKDISSRDLKRVREFAIGDYVVHGPWLGRVDDVLDNVTVLIDDGSVCKVVGAEPLRLKPISKSIFDEDDTTPYYPGQRVRASSSSVFKNSRWLSGLWKANRLEGTVIKVRAGSVFIYWLASAGYGPDSSTSPPEEQSPNNLKLLSCFAHANWQVGDWCLMPPGLTQSSSATLYKDLSKLDLHDSIKAELDSSQLGDDCDSDEYSESMDIPIGDNATPESSPCGSSTSGSKDHVNEMWPLHRKKIRKVVIRRDKKTRKREETFEKAHLIVNTRTSVDVQWQDGTVGKGLESTTLIPIDSPGDHEFLAEQYVVEKASDVDNAFETRRVGVVKSVNANERTACVRWLKPVSRAEDLRQFDKEEIVSVYELEEHPDYDYAYGDVVVRLSPVTISSTGGEFLEENQETALDDSINARNRSENKKGDEVCTDFSDLSWVGNITGLRNGDIEVTWADGMVSTVGPQAIFVVGRDDDEMDSGDGGSEVSDDAASWETVNDDDEMDSMENAQEEVGVRNATNVNSEGDERMDSSRSPALSLPLAALDFVTRLATGIFSRGQKNLDSDLSDNRSENECKTERIIHISEEKDCSDGSSSQKSRVFENGSLGITHDKGGEDAIMGIEVPISSNSEETLSNLTTEISDSATCSEDDTSSFKRFDIVKDPLDHYYLGSSGQINNGRKWLKKVQQDWSILQNNLPEGIYVRVYEDRMDLLRAVIVGAYGTPYQDGLFFFDFHLPPEYPDVPLSAYYHSGGWRINPNLYEEGKVCLSLLNTWTGRGNEVWDPMSSSILQVLVSLQGLVLNSRPYFNEAGYDKQIGTAEGEKNSLSYNENTFLLNCKTMMYLMRKTPKDFEELVKEHFRKRGHYILKACDAYMKGSLIGSLAKDASVSNNDNTNLTSVGFKLMLAKIVPKLYSALNEIGADCHGFEHLLQS